MEKVLIIWAGPAGSFLAYSLWKQGIESTLIDKVSFPRNKPCGGGLSLECLDLMDFSLPKDIKESEIDSVKFLFSNAREEIVIDLKHPIANTIKRDKFDNFLLDTALATGKVDFINKKITTIEKKDGKIEILFDDWELLNGDFLVWADGANSFVKTKVLNQKPFNIKAFAVAYDRIKLDSNLKKNQFVFEFWKDKGGYAWIFPNKKDFNIWIGCTSQSSKWYNIKERLKEFTTEFNGNDSNEKILGHTLPYLCNFWRNGKDNIILIGDAAGLVEPFTGEGIRNALYSAKIASESILASIRNQSSLSKEYFYKMYPKYIELFLIYLFMKWFHHNYNFTEKVILKNQYLIHDYIRATNKEISMIGFMLKTFIKSPYLILKAFL